MSRLIEILKKNNFTLSYFYFILKELLGCFCLEAEINPLNLNQVMLAEERD